MDNYIPYGRQSISQADIDAVIRVLKSDWITQGPAIAQFEKTVAEYCGAKFAVAVTSATAGLHIACLAAGLGEGDWLWTSPNTFVASANCALYCGANIDFVDIDPKTYNISVDALEQKLIQAEKQGTLPKIVVPVHFSGQPCEMECIYDLSQQYGFTVLEDASHAIGASYRGKPVGSCQYSDMAVFSFHPVKIITTGEGGMVLTNRQGLHEKLIRLRTHGITRNQALMSENHGGWYYQQLELGFNYRITDLQAALGISQMSRLKDFVHRRRQLAAKYDELLKILPITLPMQHPASLSSWHLYVIRLQLDQIKLTHKEVFHALREAGIGVNLHYIPVHLQPYYQNLNFKLGDFPESEQYYREAISLPLHFELTEEDQNRIVNTLFKILNY